MPQFDRVAELLVGKPGAQGVRITGALRMRFQIERDDKPAANTCEVEVYNLSEQTRRGMLAQQDDLILRAGYAQGDGLSILFRGQLDSVEHRFVPPHVITTLAVGDGRRSLRESRLSLSLERGCSVGRACRVIAERMQLPIKEPMPQEADSTFFAEGFAFSGQGEEALRRATAAADLEYSVQNEQVQILRRYGTGRDPPVPLSPQTGLLDSPERVTAAKERPLLQAPKEQWKVRSLLNPRFLPGQRCELSSRAVSGTFRVDAVRHLGDTWGDEWFTELELSL